MNRLFTNCYRFLCITITVMENDPYLQALHRMIELQEKILLKLDGCIGVPLPKPDANEIISDLVHTADVIQKLGVSRSTIYRLTKAKEIHPKKVGKTNFYSLKEISGLVHRFMK